jgi:hypothetical protein
VEWATPVLYLRASDGRIFDTPSIDRSGLERPASLGAAPVDTGDLDKPAGRPAPAAEPEPAAPAAVHEPPPVAPPPASIPAAATAQPPPHPPAGATKDALPPAARKPVEPKSDEDDEATVSPWALPFPIPVDEPAPEARRAGGHTPATGRAGAPRTPRSVAAEPSRRGGVGEWTDDASAWEGTASGGAWPPETGKWTTEEEYPPASSSGGGRWLLVLLLVLAVAFVAWLALRGDDGTGTPDRMGDTEQARTEADTERGSTERGDTDTGAGTTDTGSTDTENSRTALELLVSECRVGNANDACSRLLEHEAASPEQRQVAFDFFESACSNDDLAACARVLRDAPPDTALWERVFEDVVECRSGGFDACGEVARQYGDQLLSQAVEDWLASCQGSDREACERVLGFAEPGSSPWSEADGVLSEIPAD